LFEDDKGEQGDPAEDVMPPEGPPVMQAGDLRLLGEHRLLCADATDPVSYDCLMDAVFASPFASRPSYRRCKSKNPGWPIA